MKFHDLLKLVVGLPSFDFALLAQLEAAPAQSPTESPVLSPAPHTPSRSALRVQLARWTAEGKLLPLRRGMYCLAAPYAPSTRNTAALSAQLCSPSYLSDLWALGFYDLIPERVPELTAVTTRLPCRYENALGVFSYRHVKSEAFFGYRQTSYAGETICVAEPEKALLDHWHLSTGDWTPARIEEMRYQNVSVVNDGRLLQFARRFKRPRLLRIAETWLAWRKNSERDDADGSEVIL
jgi:hypothetical protein